MRSSSRAGTIKHIVHTVFGRTEKRALHRWMAVSLPILLSALAGCSNGRSAAQTDPELAKLEREMVDAVNSYRASIGLNRLRSREKIAGQSRLHSKAMAADEVPLAHDGAGERADNIREEIPWRSISENVAFSDMREDLVDFILARWLESPAHRTNIEGIFDLTGIGAARSSDGRYFFTQIFVLTE